MANAYITNTQIKALMPDSTWGTSFDALLTTLAERASRALDRHLKRKPGAFAVTSTAARYYGPERMHGVLLRVDELAAAPTSVALALTGDIDNVSGSGGTYTALATTDYFLDPENAADEGLPYTGIRLDNLNGAYSSWYSYPRGVKVVGKWGYSTSANIPLEVVEITGIQAVRWFQRGKQGFRDVGAIVELSQLSYAKELDPDVSVLLSSNLNRVTI